MLSTAKPASSPCELDRLRDQIAAARRKFAQTGGKVQKLDWAGQPVGEYVDVPVVPVVPKKRKVVAAVPKPAPDPAKASLAAALAAVAAPAKPEPTGCLQVEIVKAKPVESFAEIIESLDRKASAKVSPVETEKPETQSKVNWARFDVRLNYINRKVEVVRKQIESLRRDLKRSAKV